MPFNYQFVDMSTFKDDTSFQNPNDPGKIYPMYFRGDSQNRIYSLDTRTNLGNPDLNFKHAKILTDLVIALSYDSLDENGVMNSKKAHIFINDLSDYPLVAEFDEKLISEKINCLDMIFDEKNN